MNFLLPVEVGYNGQTNAQEGAGDKLYLGLQSGNLNHCTYFQEK